MTKEEKRIWYDFLKKLPVAVKRQRVIGNYIADFYIPQSKTVIEIDGRQHQMESHIEYDNKRTEYIENRGIKVLRYSNKDINNNFKSVCQDILNYLGLTAIDVEHK